MVKGRRRHRSRHFDDEDTAAGVCSCGGDAGPAQERHEELFRELFRLHDLDGNGTLEENELVQLNEQVAVLHHGPGADLQAVRQRYRELYRTKLDPQGIGFVNYVTFQSYAREVLDRLDPDAEAQEMILEQFVAEASSARHALNYPPPGCLPWGDLPVEDAALRAQNIVRMATTS
jgi:hypothetical protein